VDANRLTRDERHTEHQKPLQTLKREYLFSGLQHPGVARKLIVDE
jgi:hypothetical protein